MKKSFLAQHEQGSAEQVIAHAAWQRSRGRNPSMPFITQRNPRKALALANSVVSRVKWTELIDSVGADVVRGKSYRNMNDAELKIAAKHIITSSSSEAEVHERLRNELDYPYRISLHTNIPDDKTGREARELVRGLGGLVMKNGAMAMAMMHGRNGTIHL